MSGRRRKEMPPGDQPGDGEPQPSAYGYGEPEDLGPFARRPQDRRGLGPASRDPYGSRGYRDEPYDPREYERGGAHLGRQGGGLPPTSGRGGPGGPGGSGGHGERGPAGTDPGYGGPGYGGPGYGGPGYGPSGSNDHSSDQGYGSPGYRPSGYGSTGSGRSGYGSSGSESSGYGSSGSGDTGSGGRGGGGDGYGPGGYGSSSGGERRRRAVRRRTIGTLIGPLAGALGLAILLGAGVYALADSRGCGGGAAVNLNIAVAPEIAPAVSDITSSFNKEQHSANGKCVKATVKPSDPAAMTTLLSGQGSVPGETKPDMWIPDSSFWVTLVHSSVSGAASVYPSPTTMARTPLVVATSRTFANKIQKEGIRPTWDMLLKATDALSAGAVSKNDMLPANSVHLQILDPNRNAGGIGAVVMTHMLLQGDPNADPIFTQIVRNVQNSLSPNTQALFASFNRDLHGKAPVVIAPEQAIWNYNHDRPKTPATAIYPSEGLLSLDYPVTLTTTDQAKVRAAGLLEQALGGAKAQAAVRALGFRTPDGHPGDNFNAGNGLSPRVPRALPTPAAGDVTDVMQAWAKLSLRMRMLTLLDVSGSMAQPVAKGVTRLQATAKVAQGGLGLLPDDTDLGLWTFSTHLKGPIDYRTEVPIGPLSTRLGSGTRRQAVLAALNRVRPKPDGDTGLYDSVLASVRSLQRTYKAGYYNTVLVLTDGKNDDDHGISLNTLLSTLKARSDPDKPVMVVFIGFGPDVDMPAMQKIATATNGAAYQAMKPQDVQRILLQTLARRICAPQCH